jgi:hypothetical protein
MSVRYSLCSISSPKRPHLNLQCLRSSVPWATRSNDTERSILLCVPRSIMIECIPSMYMSYM